MDAESLDPENTDKARTKWSQDGETGELTFHPSAHPNVTQSNAKPPAQIEEFAILQALGRGGFGTVYLAFDNTLQREVAIKIPHHSLVKESRAVAEYLREARATASLDHPNIIPVYRASSTPTIPCYIVTKRIRGCHLGQWRLSAKPSFQDIARLFAKVAKALAYAHGKRLVHRDVKPGNILVDDDGYPYVADFGLALREVDVSDQPVYIGTPVYMSPEQARGEGHRVDGRSDIFSLGIMLYEFLTGRKPFTGDDRRALLHDIQFAEPMHPCMIRAEVPPELARICMKAMSKSVVNRYQTADVIADELLAFDAASARIDDGSGPTPLGRQPSKTLNDLPGEAASRIVPKGLRPFERRDSDSFLQLLPGPYDRDGLPEGVRFWVSRLTGSEGEKPLTVGLIYGPSGCGKTSLVRAGLIPQLPREITTIYLQASNVGTEAELCRQLVSRIPAMVNYPIDEHADIAQLLTHLRRLGQGRTVIFIDQFEQWLFAHPDSQKEPLTQALRQCDGEHLQCVLMVRDDFWMGITRLMNFLDVTIAENVDVRAVDLFDTRHARHVLSLFGIAYGRLPELREQWTSGQSRFIDAAVKYLAVDGRVICVQLALLAEMMKSRAWENGMDLFSDGGTSIGTKFLDETFDSENSSRRIRIHNEGAHRILRAILPEAGSRIKGAVLSEEELFNVSGYRDRAFFKQLVAILDRELHLITPTDRADASVSDESSVSDSALTGYQLTHDFLIAPIRQWVEYRNRTSKAGKAKLRLEEFSLLYQARPRPQSLPSISDYIAIRMNVPSRDFTNSQRRMMTVAQRRHLRTLMISVVVLTLLVASGLFTRNSLQRHTNTLANRALVEQLLHAEFAEAIQLADKLQDNHYARIQAADVVAYSHDQAQQVRAALLIHDTNPQASTAINEYAFTCPVGELVALVDAYQMPLPAFQDTVLDIWNRQDESSGKLLRAACLLADDPELQQHLQKHQDRLLQLLLAENPGWINDWAKGFQSSRSILVPLLTQHLKAESRSSDSLNAINLLSVLAADDLRLLVSLVAHVRLGELLPLVQTIQLLAIPEASQWLQDDVKKVREQILPTVDPARPWGSPWWCVGNRKPVSIEYTKSLPMALRERLDAVESAVGDHAIVSHLVPDSEFKSLNKELETCGYRIADLMPLPDAQRSLMVLWIRDGAESRYIQRVTADELRKLNEQHRQDRFLPDNVSLSIDAGQLVYSAVWIKPPVGESLLDADMYVDIHQSVHQADGWGPLSQRGLGLPRANRFISKQDGFDYFTSVRWQVANDIHFQDSWNRSDEASARIQALNRSTAPVSSRHVLNESQGSDSGVTNVWWLDMPLESLATESLPRREHLREAQRMMEQAYYPVSIDVDFQQADQGLRYGSVWWRGLPTSESQVQQGTKLRNLSFVLMMLGHPETLEEILASKHQEELRGATLEAFGELQIPVAWLLARLANHHDLNLRRACGCALALYPQSNVSQSIDENVQTACIQILSKVRDPGLRSALNAIADAWQFEIGTIPANPSYEIDSMSKNRLVIIHPEEPIWCGSPASEPGRDGGKEPLTSFRLKHDFAIATHEVTVAQFLKFRPGHKWSSGYASSLDSPVIDVSLFDAMAYCRWLSEVEGMAESDMCYPPLQAIKPSMTLPQNYLDRSGYRLPTEAEWEHACRGGASQGRWFGFDPNRLHAHAWTAQNSDFQLHRIGRLLPNDFGLFDMLGNSMEWSQTQYLVYPRLQEESLQDPAGEKLTIEANDRYATRGGSMLYQPLDARASQRSFHSAETVRVYLSFRIAKTVSKVGK